MSPATAKLTQVTDNESTVAQLEEAIAALQLEKRHTSLTHRDYVMGLRAQMTTERAELLEISAGFANALAVLEDRDRTIVQLTETVAKLRTKLARERATSAERARELTAVRESRTWRVGRVLTKPLSVFKR